MAYSNRSSKRGVPDVAPVMRGLDGKLTTRPPFTPSASAAAKVTKSTWRREMTRHGWFKGAID
jgi:hypothetical protein